MKIRIISGRKEYIITEQEERKTLLSSMQEHGVYLDAPCNGRGSCGCCKVLFSEGETDGKKDTLPDPTEKEKILLSEEELKTGIRLACCTFLKKDCTVFIPDAKQSRMFVQTERETGTDKAVKKADRTQRPFGEQTYGIAVDIGTTTLAMELVNFRKNTVEGVVTSINRQRMFGADVISRIQAANEGKGALLRETVCSDLNRMIETLLKEAGQPQTVVKKIAVAGNTTMCHLLLGYSCRTLGEAPFRPVDVSLHKTDARTLLHREGMNAEVWILPGISAFAGADLVSCIYGSGMDLKRHTAMLLDIGTNGEMAIGNKDGFFVTSAAAGPVFEGGGVSCGVPGIPGAITHISLDEGIKAICPAPTGDFLSTRDMTLICRGSRLETIEGKVPVGLCGTGIIDLTAELLMNGLIDENGTLCSPWFENGFPITEDGLIFLQSDIREVQMGKSAIRAGIETLLTKYGSALPDTVYLSGGFGCYMDAGKAERIGLFPKGIHKKIVSIGNGALEGARRFLTDETGIERVNRIAALAEEINLAKQEQFNEQYLEHMFFETNTDSRKNVLK